MTECYLMAKVSSYGTRQTQPTSQQPAKEDAITWDKSQYNSTDSVLLIIQLLQHGFIVGFNCIFRLLQLYIFFNDQASGYVCTNTT